MLRKLAPVIVLAVGAFGLAVPAAVAVGTGTPTVTTPANGSTVPAGFTGPVTVDFSNAPADAYGINIDCFDSGYMWSTTFDYTGDPDTVTYTIPKIIGPDSCDIDVGTLTTDNDTQFKVAAPPHPIQLRFSRERQRPHTFYPRVRDNYKDTTTRRFRTNLKSEVRVKITNDAGKVVVKRDLGQRKAGSHSWVWSGRNSHGRTVPAGRYVIQLSGRPDNGPGGLATGLALPVHVAPGRR